MESMPSFWHNSPSSSTSTTQDFSDQFSPTSSSTSLYRKNTMVPRKFTETFDAKRSNSQAGIMEALMSPRQVLSPSSSIIIQPSQSASIVGGSTKEIFSKYFPRQVSLDNSYNFSTATQATPAFPSSDVYRKIPLNKTSSYDVNNDSYEGKLSPDFNYARKPHKRLDTVQHFDGNKENRKKASHQSVEGQTNHFQPEKQMSESSSASTIGNVAENEIPLRSGLDFSLLKEKRINGKPDKSLVNNGSSYSSLSTTAGKNAENGKSEDQ